MNIFVLDEDPIQAARYHCDKHVCKMIVESMQLLLNPFIKQGIKIPFRNAEGRPYKMSHPNHPCAKWTEISYKNFVWLAIMGMELCKEYGSRYNKTHACKDVIKWCVESRDKLVFQHTEMTPFVLAMPDEYKDACPVKAYRDYYLNDKITFARWNHGKVPDWWPKNEIPTFLVA